MTVMSDVTISLAGHVGPTTTFAGARSSPLSSGASLPELNARFSTFSYFFLFHLLKNINTVQLLLRRDWALVSKSIASAGRPCVSDSDNNINKLFYVLYLNMIRNVVMRFSGKHHFNAQN